MGCLIWLCQLLFLHLFNFHSQVAFSSFSAASAAATLVQSDQCNSLLEFRNTFSIDKSSSSSCDALGITSYPKTITWNESKHCCSWDGVMCDKLMSNIISLDLSCSWLRGTIHSNNSLFSLPLLQRLNLAYNALVSRIPSKLGEFTSLTHLNLSTSLLSGQIPPQISYLSNLVSVDFSGSSFQLSMGRTTWTGLVKNLTNLRELFLDEVDMSSIVTRSLTNLSASMTSLSLQKCLLRGKIPANIFCLMNLQELILASNEDLIGQFPNCNCSNSLRFLDLSSTSLSGEIPDSVGNLKQLRKLDLHRCNFTGSIPASLANLTKLTFLDLSANINFTGEIPSSFSNFQQLAYLDLSQNSFKGQIPNVFSNHSKLVHLSLSKNNFQGQIPDVFSNLTELVHLSLSKNNFQGHLPSSAFQILKISEMDFSENQLEGPIPSHVCELPHLTGLLLNDNKINRTIPSCIFTLPSLLHLDLSHNQLTGQLAEFHSKILERISLGKNKLNGSVPGSIFELVILTIMDLSTNNFSGNLDLNKFSKLQNLWFLDLSYNSLVLIDNSNVNYTLPLFSLKLSSCKLSEFPQFLRAAELLVELDLSSNQIRGKIPKWMVDVGKGTLGYLNLSYNCLTDIEQIPWETLQFLDLSANMLQGPLPVPPPIISYFLVSGNKFAGELPLSFCNMSFVSVLDLSNNNLSGIIPPCFGIVPPCFGHFSCQLSVLNLGMNSFHGTIPDTFGKGSLLRNINFNNNKLVGPLPKSLINCRKLEVLDLGNNKLNGSFSHWLGTLPDLQVLVLRFNKFQGPISNPRSTFSFPKLRIIDLSHNEFTGPLPIEYFKGFKALMNGDNNSVKPRYMGEDYYQDSVIVTMKGLEIELVKIITIFATIDFSSNQFRGEIMENIGKLKSLRGLNFSHNALTGHMPPSLGNLTNLEWLDLSVNKLVGEIPIQWVAMTSLSFINLSRNHLVGHIPQGKQFNTFQNDSYIGNLGLCGFPMSKSCDDDMAREPPPAIYQDEDDSPSVFAFGWKVVLIGYASGTLLGLAIGYLVFRTRKPKWLVKMVEGRRH